MPALSWHTGGPQQVSYPSLFPLHPLSVPPYVGNQQLEPLWKGQLFDLIYWSKGMLLSLFSR